MMNKTTFGKPMPGLTWREELGIEKVTVEKKAKPECGAWLELPCPQKPEGPAAQGLIVKCDKGKHRGKAHSYSFEFHLEEHEGSEPWRYATVEWRS